tara:strand:- start:4458 stop:5306 length:849 start_codon:yes stop_codon:yes gene_type:complete
MNLKFEDITFIIVTYQSENVLYECLDSLPKKCKKIIVDNSNHINLEKDLNLKYDNIEVIMSKNVGMGAGNNIGLGLCKTNFAYVLNPDTKMNEDTLFILLKELENVKDFTLASPLNSDLKCPNYKKIFKNENIHKNILSVSSIDGFSMLINLKKFNDPNLFDENYFLYLENDDLCLRVKKNKEKIYIIKNSFINHIGGISKNKDLEYLRNWHWMWSKFYFNKKHYGYLKALYAITLNLLSSILKFIFFTLIFNSHKKKVNYMRMSGILNSIFGKKSWLRNKN